MRVVPGSLLGEATKFCCGAGTFEAKGNVYSSLAGFTELHSPEDALKDPRPSVSVRHFRRAAKELVPAEGNLVYGRVSRITTGVVNVDIKVYSLALSLW